MEQDKPMEKRAMSMMGRMFCGIENEGASTVCHGAMYLQTRLSLNELRIVVTETMSRDPRFRSVIIREDLTFQPKETIDIVQHTFEVTLPEGSTRADVEDFIGDCVLKPFPEHLPPWQYYLLQIPDGKEFQSVIVIRMSHCLGDGTTMVQLLLSMTTEISAPKTLPPVKRTRKSRGCICRLFTLPFRIISFIWTIIMATLIFFLPADKDSAIKGKLGGKKCIVTSDPFSVDEFKEVGKKYDATINDVIASCVAGAIRRYCLDTSVGTGKVVPVRAIIPVNLRPPKGGKVELGNKIAFVNLPLNTTESHPVKRLKTMTKRTNKIKDSPEAPWNYFTCIMFYYLFTRKIWLLLCQRYTSRFTLVLTNVAGPRTQLAIAGRPLVSIIGWVPAGKCGLTISVLSYAGKIIVGILADTNVVKQPHKLLKFFEEEWHALQEKSKTN